MRILKFFPILVLSVTITACPSLPIRQLPVSKTNSEIASIGTVAIIGCKDYQPISEYELSCQSRSKELAGMLERTKLFTKVLVGKHDADYWVELNPYSRYPYWMSMGHNPAILVLSLAIPFWESYEYGFDFTISPRNETKGYRINTLETGTHLMWSISILINVLPSRGIPGTYRDNEIKHLKFSLINTLNEKS